MTLAPRLHQYTFEDYIRLERDSTVRHEFLAGEIYAMAGGTPEHAALAVVVSAAFLSTLRGGPCRVHSSDLRVRVPSTGLTTYPDVTVVCGPYETDSADKHTVTNPKVVVEITSDSTNEYDRGEKLQNYQQVAGLDAIVILSHRDRRIEVFERDGEGWKRTEASAGQVARVGTLDVKLVVDEIYDAIQVR